MVWFIIGTGQNISGSFLFLFFHRSLKGIRRQPGNTRQEWKAYNTMLFDYSIKSKWTQKIQDNINYAAGKTAGMILTETNGR